MESCGKRRFASRAAARRQLRVWQQHSRRAAFDTVHTYWCGTCRGYHVGHSDKADKRTRAMGNPNSRRKYEPPDHADDLDTIFARSTQRARRKARAGSGRYRRRMIETFYEGDAMGTTRQVDDTMDVERRS